MTGDLRRISCNEYDGLSRRTLLQGGASLALWGMMPKAATARDRDARLLFVILRGGLDGISLAAPVGDPDYQRLRGELAIPLSGAGAGRRLDGFFALHPAMDFLHQLYQRREALLIHAIATPYRGRSHFDGQDVLESGLGGKGRSDDGWLNRALGGLNAGGAIAPAKGLAMGAVVPLVMRGAAPVMTWTPKTYEDIPLRHSTVTRLMNLYTKTDPELAKALGEGLEIDRMGGAMPGGSPSARGGAKRRYRSFIEAAAVAAKFLAAAGGPRIGALSYNGWDTHFNEGVNGGRLARTFSGLDAAIQALHDGLGAAWKDTVVVFATEFGRTARTNGTRGTDHGTATAAFLTGGAVKGGRIIADWPGLKPGALYEGRDLMPTQDLRAILKGVLRDHLGVPKGALASRVFPQSSRIAPLDDLIA